MSYTSQSSLTEWWLYSGTRLERCWGRGLCSDKIETVMSYLYVHVPTQSRVAHTTNPQICTATMYMCT